LDAELRAVRGSVLLTGELGVRPRMTLERWLSLSDAERSATWDVGISAVRRVDHVAWRERIDALAEARYEPAVPTLIELWERCPVHPVLVGVGHALFEIGTVEARAVLADGLDDHEYFQRFLALRVVFTDVAPAWERLAGLFTAERLAHEWGWTVAREALAFLVPSGWQGDSPLWTLDSAQRARVMADRRWAELCIELREHEELGSEAREALRYMDEKVVSSLLAAADARRPTQSKPPPLRAGAVVARYEGGDHVGAWSAVRAVGALDAAWRAEAEQLAVVTMTRVRANAEQLVAALVAAGWPIDPSDALPGPPAELEAKLDELARLTDDTPIPPAVAAFWRIVGSIHLAPDLEVVEVEGVPSGLFELDPLEVDDPVMTWYSVEEWQDAAAGVRRELAGPIELSIAPDHLHKANISGGPPYALWLPDEGADPLVRNEVHRLPFTDYLRHTLAGHGFARRASDDPDATAWLARLEVELDGF